MAPLTRESGSINMRLQLYRGVGADESDEPLRQEARWKDLQVGCRISWTADGQPVRQIAPRSRLPVGRYNSRKAGRMLPHQSRGHGSVGGEKLALMICEIDPAVVDFRSQHIRFDLLAGGAMRTYFPDIVSLMHDGTIAVIEVKKNACWQTDPVYSNKIDTVGGICADLGWDFQVWTQSGMAPSPRVRDNIAQIQMQRFVGIDDVQSQMVARALQSSEGRLTVGEIKCVLGSEGGTGDVVRGLMCRGLLRLPLDEQISDKTIATAFTRCASPHMEHAE
jgi:hypothetical protein